MSSVCTMPRGKRRSKSTRLVSFNVVTWEILHFFLIVYQTMSRPQGHRKSQSTSALSVLAGDRSTKHGRRFVVAGGGGGGGRKGRASQHPALGRVEEGNVGSASMMILPELDADGDRPRGSGASVEDMKRRSMGKMVNQDDVKGWMNDVSHKQH